MADRGAFVRFPKPLMDCVMLTQMGSTQLAVTLAVIRWTIGNWNRDQARLSVSYLAQVTGRPRSSVARALANLICEGVVIVDEPSAGPKPASIHVNPDASAWGAFVPSTPCGRKTEAKRPHPCVASVHMNGVYRPHGVDAVYRDEESLKKERKKHPPPPLDMTPDEGRLLDALRDIPGWSLKPDVDLDMLRRLRLEYPRLDLPAELRAFRFNVVDKPIKPKDKPRSRLHTWCRKAVEFGREIRDDNYGLDAYPDAEDLFGDEA